MSLSHRNYFNRIAPEWEGKMPAEPEFAGYLKRFGVASGDFVLDVGAGAGRMTRLLADAVGPDGCVVAQDIALQMLIETRRIIRKPLPLVCDDVHALAYPDCMFDKVLCFSAFPHFMDQSMALAEMTRVLKPGGGLLVLHNRSSADLNDFHASLDGPVNRDRLPPAPELASMMRKTGLRPIRVKEETRLYWVEAGKPR